MSRTAVLAYIVPDMNGCTLDLIMVARQRRDAVMRASRSSKKRLFQ